MGPPMTITERLSCIQANIAFARKQTCGIRIDLEYRDKDPGISQLIIDLEDTEKDMRRISDRLRVNIEESRVLNQEVKHDRCNESDPAGDTARTCRYPAKTG